MPNNNNLFWVDLEMTGLSDEQVIVEIASLVTDADLNILAEGPELAIHRTPQEMARLEEWPAKQHKKSGLLDRIEASKIDVAEAEAQTLEFLKKWTEKGKAPLCGNSIWVDRRFLHKEMPTIEDYLHYRMIDVSSIKDLAGWWYGIQHRKPKGAQHTALWDTRQSIAELKYYREQLFNPEVESAE